MSYAIRFYRCQAWARAFSAAGIYKPEGMVTSRYKTGSIEKVQQAVDHINAERPQLPAHVVRVT